MHESHLVGQLLDEAERRAEGPVDEIASLRLEIGALAAVSREGLVHGATDAAVARWGFAPALEVSHADDPLDAAAQGVKLLSITLGTA